MKALKLWREMVACPLCRNSMIFDEAKCRWECHRDGVYFLLEGGAYFDMRLAKIHELEEC